MLFELALCLSYMSWIPLNSWIFHGTTSTGQGATFRTFDVVLSVSVSKFIPSAPITMRSIFSSLAILQITDSGLPRRRITSQMIWEDILEHFSSNDSIDFAYPTTRFYKTETDKIN